VYRRTHSSEDRYAWIQQLKSLHRLYESKSRHYWWMKTEDSNRSSRKLWQPVASLMGDEHGKNVDEY
jgi:hypothetical protein